MWTLGHLLLQEIPLVLFKLNWSSRESESEERGEREEREGEERGEREGEERGEKEKESPHIRVQEGCCLPPPQFFFSFCRSSGEHCLHQRLGFAFGPMTL